MTLNISPDWLPERGEGAPRGACHPADRATLARVSLQVNTLDLIRAEDRETDQVRTYAILPANSLAEWFAWNWWRLVYEPPRQGNFRTLQWRQAHQMAGIGGGWMWPPITIYSDGERVVIRARPTPGGQPGPLTYTADQAAVIPTFDYQEGIDRFVSQVLSQLEVHDSGQTDLHTLWQELGAERLDPEVARFRETEARLGYDPDEADPDLVSQLLGEAETLGEQAINEIAGHSSPHPITGAALQELAARDGFHGRTADRVRLDHRPPVQRGAAIPAWRVGVETARALRNQERLGDGPLSNRKLAELCGVAPDAPATSTTSSAHSRDAGLAFDIAEDAGLRRLVLRSRWQTGRRFEMARLLGDSLMSDYRERLLPATRTYTYRQKMQRAFAAELLAPAETLINAFADGVTEDAIEEAANDFQVSSWVVTRALINQGVLSREFLEEWDAESVPDQTTQGFP